MAISCPSCGEQFDVALFQFGNSVVCDCGCVVGEEMGRAADEERLQARQEMLEIQRKADRVCALILNEGCSEADLEVEMDRVRAEVLGLYPHRSEFFFMIYESRFKRLREQFRR